VSARGPGPPTELPELRIDPRPGDLVLLVIEVEVLTRRETPWGPQFMVAVPRPVKLEDFASEGSLRKVVEAASGSGSGGNAG
jgi:hypothetical protein